MNQIRMTRELYDRVRSDLCRSHPFAEERVGFLYFRTGTSPSGNLILLSDYVSVPDECYIRDFKVGARLNSEGILLGLQRPFQTGEGILHVHMHGNFGIPNFSRIDLADLPNFVRSFRNASPREAHGALLLSQNRMLAQIWYPGEETPTVVTNYTIVGAPMSLFKGGIR